MARARRPLQVVGVLAAAALVATGCGGGGETVAPVEGATPTPDGGAGATTVGTPGATDPLTGAPAATDPATGLPVDPAATDSGSTATVPELVGDDVAGGLAAVSDTTPIFDAQAVKTDELPDTDADKGDDATKGTTSTTGTTTESTPAVTYTGAKIYVDGIVHSVNRNGTFPKGNPVFRLLSVSASDIEIALVAGEFTSSGGDGTFLDKGDLVSMVNASEQVTYRVKYLRPIAGTDAVSF